MNQFIVMAEIVEAPQLRYTSDSQLPIAEMLVRFPGLRPDDPPSQVKVLGWGNLAQDMEGNFQPGDRVVIEGRLGMRMVNRSDLPDGKREKQAELTAQKIYPLGAGATLDLPPLSSEPSGDRASATPAKSAPQATSRSTVSKAVYRDTASSSDYDYDSSAQEDIPF